MMAIALCRSPVARARLERCFSNQDSFCVFTNQESLASSQANKKRAAG
ncbi:MAG: hypothetical protein ACI8UO_004694 [Verrucomicrobiales bacterium]|jgi:hypothetical protein